jgi:hypothetical protein
MKSLITLMLIFWMHCAMAAGDASKRFGFGISDTAGASLGGTFEPGSAATWKFQRTRSGIDLSQQGPGTEDSQQIEAYLLRVDEPFQTSEKYIATMKRNLTQALAKNSYWRVLAIEFEPEANKPRCARGHIVLRDKSNTADVDARFSEQYLLSCALDKRAPFGIEVRYYNRYKGGERDPGFTARATQLIDSVEVDDK